MITELSEIKPLRRRLGLTQQQLAQQAGVSQSLIAKIEAGLLDVGYSNAKKIFAALEALSKQKEVKASQIMNSKIVSLEPGEMLQNAVKKMRKYSISQLPVVEDGKPLGVISEGIILDALMDGRNGKVEDFMEESPPLVSTESSIQIVAGLLKYYSMILVGERGKLKGIITKADLIASYH